MNDSSINTMVFMGQAVSQKFTSREIRAKGNCAKRKARKVDIKCRALSRLFLSEFSVVALSIQRRARDDSACFRITAVLPGKHGAIALPANEHAALGTPRIPGAAAAGNRGAEHTRIDEASGDHGNVHEEERVIIFLDSEIRAEHFVALPADHADDRRFLFAKAGIRICALVFNGADIAVQLGIGWFPRKIYRSHLGESGE